MSERLWKRVPTWVLFLLWFAGGCLTGRRT